MPIVQFHLVEGRQTDASIGGLLEEATRFYAETLYPTVSPLPLDRVRAFVTLHRTPHWVTAGVLAANGGADAPYFTCLALAGRPAEQLHNLLRGVHELVETACGCDRGRVRGQVSYVETQA